MTFMDFMEYCEATINKIQDEIRNEMEQKEFIKFSSNIKDSGYSDLSSSHIFYLGEDADFTESIRSISTDVIEECSYKIPLPYPDISCISRIDNKIKLTGGVLKSWLLDRIVEVGPENQQEYLKMIPPTMLQDIKTKGWTINQLLCLVRIVEPNLNSEFPQVFAMHVYYCGSDNKDYRILSDSAIRPLYCGPPAPDNMLREFSKQVIPCILMQAASISHPMNYIIKTSPVLTPRETRRKERGIEPSIRKKPHFIVVDHDVLVSMRSKTNGTHASPIPHHRRGHWMRLAERCRHAKLLGKKKAWVRPTFVGDRKFSDDKNLYEVLLDFKPHNVLTST